VLYGVKIVASVHTVQYEHIKQAVLWALHAFFLQISSCMFLPKISEIGRHATKIS